MAVSRLGFCAKCRAGLSSIAKHPSVCPFCDAETTWTRTPLGPWIKPLTVMEKQFLKSLRIASED